MLGGIGSGDIPHGGDNVRSINTTTGKAFPEKTTPRKGPVSVDVVTKRFGHKRIKTKTFDTPHEADEWSNKQADHQVRLRKTRQALKTAAKWTAAGTAAIALGVEGGLLVRDLRDSGPTGDPALDQINSRVPIVETIRDENLRPTTFIPGKSIIDAETIRARSSAEVRDGEDSNRVNLRDYKTKDGEEITNKTKTLIVVNLERAKGLDLSGPWSPLELIDKDTGELEIVWINYPENAKIGRIIPGSEETGFIDKNGYGQIPKSDGASVGVRSSERGIITPSSEPMPQSAR
jgi:hypothetical protein